MSASKAITPRQNETNMNKTQKLSTLAQFGATIKSAAAAMADHNAACRRGDNWGSPVTVPDVLGLTDADLATVRQWLAVCDNLRDEWDSAVAAARVEVKVEDDDGGSSMVFRTPDGWTHRGCAVCAELLERFAPDPFAAENVVDEVNLQAEADRFEKAELSLTDEGRAERVRALPETVCAYLPRYLRKLA